MKQKSAKGIKLRNNIIVHTILAIGSLLTYRNSKSYREEGGI